MDFGWRPAGKQKQASSTLEGRRKQKGTRKEQQQLRMKMKMKMKKDNRTRTTMKETTQLGMG